MDPYERKKLGTCYVDDTEARVKAIDDLHMKSQMPELQHEGGTIEMLKKIQSD